MTQQMEADVGVVPAHAHWRPRYHVTGERNWINDPNGPALHDGTFHVFFQANPDAPAWGPPHWGHVSSVDLVRWTRHETALSPGSSGPDVNGCWSGCLRGVDGRPAIYYTGVVEENDERVESVCRAWGSADLANWSKDDANPLIPAPPASLGSGYHRDPFLWHDGHRWQMLLGSGTLTGERHGQIVRYESLDATSWDYRGVLFSAPRSLGGLDLGEHWECPQLVFDGDRAILAISCQDPQAARSLMHSVYFTGSIVDGRFVGELGGLLDHGDVLYAPAVMTDGEDRTLLWGWAQERVRPETQATMGHVGALSLPRVLAFDGSRVGVAPAPELDGLRLDSLGSADELAQGVVVDDPAVELAATLARPDDGWVVESGDARLAIITDSAGDAVHVEVSDTVNGARVLSIPRSSESAADVRVFIDGSLVEVFVSDGSALTTRVYWSTPSLRIVGTGGDSGGAWTLDTSVIPDCPSV